MKKLLIAPDLELPLDAATRRMAILAMSGAGKSNTAVVLAEAMFDAGIPWVAIDPKGDWWGVRSSKSGKGPGLQIPIFGGSHGDVPLDPGAGKVIAEAIYEQQLTCVLDVSDFEERQAFWAFLMDFGNRLFHLHRKRPRVRHLFLEECDEYIPQKPSEKGNQVKCLGVYQRIVKKGRTGGLGSTQITQRNASLNKDTLYQAELLIAMRVTGKADREAVRGWVDHHNASAEIVDSLPTLQDGEAWVSSPAWLRETKRLRFNRRRTFDSGATPVLLEGDTPPATLADVDLDKLRTTMAATIEKAKADDPELLRARITKLERELVVAKKTPAPVRLEPKVETKVEKVDVPILTTQHIKELHSAVTVLRTIFGETAKLGEEIVKARGMLGDAAGAIERAVAQATNPQRLATIQKALAPRPVQTSAKPSRLVSGSGVQQPRGVVVIGEPIEPRSIDGPSQRILDALAELEAIGAADPPRELVCFLAGYTNLTSKGFSNAVSSLRTAGHITYTGDGRVQLATSGRGLARATDVPSSPAELQARLLARLGGAAARVLSPLIEAYPASLTKTELLERSGYGNATSKGFANNVSRLRTLGFIEYPTKGEVRAAPVLFLEGAA